MTIQATTASPLAGRIAVVTGASSGIGAASGKALAARGASVALLARRKEKLDALAAEIREAGGNAVVVTVDVSKQASVDAAAESVHRQLGKPDIVVNNAGVMLPAPIAERRTSDWERMIDLNVTGAVRVIGAFVPDLLEAAAQGRPADLVNVSSIAAQNLFPNFAVYCATKAAISHLSRNLRAELGPRDVRVSMVEPGIVATELQSHVTDQGALNWLAGAKKTMTWLEPENVAETMAFTVSLPSHVNLQQITIMPTRQAM